MYNCLGQATAGFQVGRIRAAANSTLAGRRGMRMEYVEAAVDCVGTSQFHAICWHGTARSTG